MAKEINIGIVGLGNIGSGVYEIITDNSALIEKRTGVKINIKGICIRSEEKAKQLKIDPKLLTTAYADLLKNKEINVIVELIGGYEPAHTIIMEAIKAKKHVITANKAVIAKYGYEIFEAAQNNGVNLLFEAAVGGCIPIIRTIEESYSSDNIEKVFGIINGTTNFILTRMSEAMSYEEALKKAQQLGFAEVDPSFDVEGKDASQKLTILASLAFDAKITSEPYTEGITKITKQDIQYAKELGYAIKLLAVAKKSVSKNNLLSNTVTVQMRTHPTMVPLTHVFSNVSNETNAIMLSGKNTGNIFLSGKGAGKFPTATVVVTDIIEIASRTRIAERHFAPAEIEPIGMVKSRYYLRFNVIDKPGVLAKITKILGDNSISIAAFTQKEENKEVVPIVILTHIALEENMAKAMTECNKLDVVKGNSMLIRIEDFS